MLCVKHAAEPDQFKVCNQGYSKQVVRHSEREGAWDFLA